ncbi:spore germination protein [Paenibacillus alginolyticus]|uniref:GerAB/ArcD/ProY family transporter n=1 Tax=Paenibacillus alginolyticus TaxID=59839 RepID=UPI0003FA730B|nr:GerAB/ArcD/ProY family transporter [Paenibacillus alginolyticus]MCY9665776.1 spore germination protein [Paenibacillus alginolyticus]
MKKEQISENQLFSLVILFEIGSTTLFSLGVNAKRDAWISILIALLAGLGLQWLYTEIQKYFPNQNLTEILVSVLGKWLAAPLIILFALSFFWTASFNLFEFSEFLISAFLPTSPLWAVLLLFIFLMVYGLFLGIEVLARSSEIILPCFLFFIIATFFLVGISGDMKFERLFPILKDGITPVLKTAPEIITTPFGEMYIFLMYWCYVNNQQVIRKISLLAVSISGILLAISIINMITVLGVQLTSLSTIPLFRVIKHIDIVHFIQRLDAIGGSILFLGGLYKATLYFNGSFLALKTLFNVKLKHQKWLIILMAIFIYWYIMVYFIDYTFYKWSGSQINNKIVIPIYAILIPILLLIIIKVKIKYLKMEK